MGLKLVKRKKIFEQNHVLAHYIYHWQRATLNPENDRYEAGETVWLEPDDEEATVLTEEQAHELNSDYEDYCDTMRDSFDETPQDAEHTGSVIAELPSKDFETFTTKIGRRLKALAEQMGWEELLIISDAKSSYLNQDNSHPPVQNAEKRLKSLGLTKEHKGGIILSLDSVEDFFSAIFWIVRCNATAPEISITAKSAPVIGTLCKYGNIHFECYDEAEERKLQKALIHADFAIAEGGACEEHFSEDGTIEGRSISLE